MKKFIALFCFVLMAFALVAQPVSEVTVEEATERVFTDSCGREVTIPAEITKVCPSGAVATMFLSVFAPDEMFSVNSAISDSTAAFLPERIATLPATGQFYGSKASLNMEQILALDPDVIIDLGDYKDGIREDMDALQEQLGIPVIFIESDLEHMAAAFRSLGEIFGRKEKGDELASFVEETLRMAAENSAKLTDETRRSVMYATGSAGLNVFADGSTHAQVISLIGANNAVVLEKWSNKGTGDSVNMEQILLTDPDVIVFASGSIYDTVGTDEAWLQLDAVKEGSYYEVPSTPYNWMANPPSMNMLLGVWWLGNLVYPDLYNYNMVEKAQEIYKLFWNYDLSTAEAEALLSKSTLK